MLRDGKAMNLPLISSSNRPRLFVGAGLAALVLAACGGGGGGGSKTKSVSPSFVVAWANRSKAISGPASAQSVVFKLKGEASGGADLALGNAFNRSSALAAHSETYATGVSVKAGTHRLHADFYASPGGTGAVVGVVDASIAVSGAGVVDSAISTASTIGAVSVVAGQKAVVGAPAQLVATATDRSTPPNLVSVTPGSFTFSLASGGAVADVAADGTVTGKDFGTATVVASTDGVTSAAAPVAVLFPAAASASVVDVSQAVKTSLSPASGGKVNVTVPAGALSAPATVTTESLDLSTVRAARRTGSRVFNPGSGDVAVLAVRFSVSPTTVTQLNAPLKIDGLGVIPSDVPAGTTLVLSYLAGEGTTDPHYVDVATFQTLVGGGFSGNLPSVLLPGILNPGTYVLYKSAGNVPVANFGVALLGTDSGVLQVFNLYGTDGKILATPSLSSLAFDGSSDMDGQALTPDGSQGVLADGDNTVRFFSGVNTGVPLASLNAVNTSEFGSDGDAVAITPDGSTAVVAVDTDQLVVITGIKTGSPVISRSLVCPGSRDAVLISDDGKTLLARGDSGLTVFAIAPQTPTGGPLGGTEQFAFTLVRDIAEFGPHSGEDGREGMAFSPRDPSKAVIAGYDSSYNPTLTVLTGLPSAPTARTTRLRLPAAAHRVARRSKKERPTRGAPIAGANYLNAVAVTLDGKSAILGTDSGLVYVSGVDTGNLVQGADPSDSSRMTFNPAFTSANGDTSLGGVSTLALTLDGAYVVAVSDAGSLLVYPLTASWFGAKVGQVDGVEIPGNDQLVLH